MLVASNSLPTLKGGHYYLNFPVKILKTAERKCLPRPYMWWNQVTSQSHSHS